MASIDFYDSDFGELTVVPNRFMRTNNPGSNNDSYNVFVMDPEASITTAQSRGPSNRAADVPVLAGSSMTTRLLRAPHVLASVATMPWMSWTSRWGKTQVGAGIIIVSHTVMSCSPIALKVGAYACRGPFLGTTPFL